MIIDRISTKDFYYEIGEGNILDFDYIHKFGRNGDIDTASGYEAIWNGGGFYTGFNAIVAEIIEVFSANAADAGTLLKSGTATGGSHITLEDTGATFITDGVAVGDIVIDDTQEMHGIVASLTETIITVHRFDKTPHTGEEPEPKAGDSYRVATTASTGLAVLKLEHMLDGDLANETSEYIILNGLTAVDTVGTPLIPDGKYRRCSRSRGVLAPPGDPVNDEITVRQKITTINKFCGLPAGANSTTICAYTIPIEKVGHMTGFFVAFAGKTNAASNVRLRTRHQGEPFVIREELSISGTGTGYVVREYKVPKNDLSPGTDIVIEADTNSNDTGIAAGFDLIMHLHDV